MAYSKLQKVIRDYALGFQSANQANDNNEALRTLYDAEHEIPVANSFIAFTLGYRGLLPGMHDAPTIPRSVGSVVVSQYEMGNGKVSAVELELTGRVIEGVERLSAGQYIVKLLPMTNAWANATPIDTFGTKVRFAKVQSVESRLGEVTGYAVMLTELRNGDFLPADYNFTFRVYAQST